MPTPLFVLRDLECSYNAYGAKVLFISGLDIYTGKLIFLLGASGAGKSTLLETLGLMNDTIVAGTVEFNPNDGQVHNYSDLWKSKDSTDIASIRRKHFSFIFQETNLMENFTAYENICLARMIKENRRQDEVVSEVYDLMDQVRLPRQEVDIDTIASNLSGGQRQRLAFVRALSSHSTVLFCDEPTGNLDERNANDLFQVIKNSLKNNSSAIVVSHSIDLALKHADQIILLTKDPAKGYGEILSSNNFERASWTDLNETELLSFKRKIVEQFIPALDHVKASSISESKVKANLNIDFGQLFFLRESMALAGKKFSNFLILIAIVLFSLVAIGFASGSLNYLEEKLNSKFVNWLTISVPMTQGSEKQIDKIKRDLDNPELRQRYKYANISAYKVCRLLIINKATKEIELRKGQTFEMATDSELIKQEILSNKNFNDGDRNGFTGEKDLSLIVAGKMLTELGYPANATYIEVITPEFDPITGTMKDFKISIPIRTIVNELPGTSPFACTEYFWKAWMIENSQNRFNPVLSTDELILYARCDASSSKRISDIINSFFKKDTSYHQYSPKTYIDPHLSSWGGGYDIRISMLSSMPSYISVDSLYFKIINLPEMTDYKSRITKGWYYSDVKEGLFTDLTYDVLSVYFASLKHVRAFSDSLSGWYNSKGTVDVIQVDRSKIKDKENFSFLSTITMIVAYLMIIFGSIAVSLFIFNLLKMHLNKVKMNIGTFKAIGLGNNKSRNIYFLITSIFVALSIVIGFSLALVIGQTINSIITAKADLETGIGYFDLLSFHTAIAITVFLISSMLVSWRTINRILSKSPGDLIYNR